MLRPFFLLLTFFFVIFFSIDRFCDGLLEGGGNFEGLVGAFGGSRCTELVVFLFILVSLNLDLFQHGMRFLKLGFMLFFGLVNLFGFAIAEIG